MAKTRNILKGFLFTTIMLLALSIMFASCGTCEHIYDDCADIECNECGEKRDSMHTWTEADCTTSKTCSVCGATEGSALGHIPEADDGDCTTEVVCSACDMTVIEAEKHDFHYTFSTASDNMHIASRKCNKCESVLENAITVVFEVEGFELTEIKGEYGEPVFHGTIPPKDYRFKVDAGEHQDTGISYYFYVDETCSNGFFGSSSGVGCLDYTLYLHSNDLYVGIEIIPNASEPITVTVSMVEFTEN